MKTYEVTFPPAHSKERGLFIGYDSMTITLDAVSPEAAIKISMEHCRSAKFPIKGTPTAREALTQTGGEG